MAAPESRAPLFDTKQSLRDFLITVTNRCAQGWHIFHHLGFLPHTALKDKLPHYKCDFCSGRALSVRMELGGSLSHKPVTPLPPQPVQAPEKIRSLAAAAFPCAAGRQQPTLKQQSNCPASRSGPASCTLSVDRCHLIPRAYDTAPSARATHLVLAWCRSSTSSSSG